MITLDLDNVTDIFEKLRVISEFFDSVKNKKIFFRESAHTGHFHIKVYGIKNNYSIRELLGDDKKRIEIDKEREKLGLPINILFTFKRYPDGEVKYAGEWKEWSVYK